MNEEMRNAQEQRYVRQPPSVESLIHKVKTINQGRNYEYGFQDSFGFNMLKIFMYTWKNKLKAQFFLSSRIQKIKQWKEYFRELQKCQKAES